MPRFATTTALAAAAASLFCAAVFAQGDEAAPSVGAPLMYTLTQVGPPPGYRGLYLEAINNEGDTAGYATKRYRGGSARLNTIRVEISGSAAG